MKLLFCTALLLCATSSVMSANIVTQCSGLFIKLCPAGYKQEWRETHRFWFDCYCTRAETPAEIAIIEKTDKCDQAVQNCIALDSFKMNDNICSEIYDYCDKDAIDTVCSTLKDINTNWQCVENYGLNDLGNDDYGDLEDYDDYYGGEDYGDAEDYDDYYGGEDFDYEDGGDDLGDDYDYEGGDYDYENGSYDDEDYDYYY